MGKYTTKISLAALAYNNDSATAYGLGWKLSYAITNPSRPVLEAFVDNSETREAQWLTYGVPYDADSDMTAELKFNGIGDEQELSIGDVSLDVRFESMGKRLVTYAKGGPTEEPEYGFVVKRRR